MLNKKAHEKNSIFENLKSKFSAFNLEKRRLDCLVQIVLGLIIVQSVTLSKIAECFEGIASLNGKIERVERFIRQIQFDENTLARVIIKIVGLNKFIISIDRTAWKIRSSFINILFLSVKVGERAIPVFWNFIEKKGNSKVEVQKEILERFIKEFGEESIELVLGDREFTGSEWIQYLMNKGIAYCIRVKKSTIIIGKRAELVFADLKALKSRKLRGKKKVLGVEGYIEGRRNEKRELMIILSGKREDGIERYANRWSIEVSFKG